MLNSSLLNIFYKYHSITTTLTMLHTQRQKTNNLSFATAFFLSRNNDNNFCCCRFDALCQSLTMNYCKESFSKHSKVLNFSRPKFRTWILWNWIASKVVWSFELSNNDVTNGKQWAQFNGSLVTKIIWMNTSIFASIYCHIYWMQCKK